MSERTRRSGRSSARGAEPPLPKVDQWFRSSNDIRLGFASGNSFELKPVRYAAIGNMAIYEGDIAIGTVDEIERVARAVSDPVALPLNGVAISGDRFRWPNGVIPYVIDPGLSNPQRVLDAIRHWTERTPIRLVPREAGNDAHQNYVSFEERDGCWSEVGMRGGKQVISIGVNCGVGQAIHEVGHAVGLWHEQSREDRDQFVEILWENVVPGLEHNFTKHVSDGDDVGVYDYGSIMHYPALAFSANGQPTIVPKQGAVIGQRAGLSELDIAAVRALYRSAPTAGPTGPQPGAGPGPGPGPGPEPGTGRQGAQLLGTIPPWDSRRWITADWPIEAALVWNIIPSPASTRVEWNVVTERQGDAQLRYYICVRNLSDRETTVEARYVML
jgi:hypothetical protein